MRLGYEWFKCIEGTEIETSNATLVTAPILGVWF
jgi:hypothetical protein